MVMIKRLTASDVCAVTGYSRDELHAVLKVLDPYRLERPSPRVAREFSAKDLIVLSVVQQLEHRYGVRRAAIGELGEQLQTAIAGPRFSTEDALLSVSFNPPLVSAVKAPSAQEGLRIALAPVYERIDQYLSFEEPQLDLQFGPQLVSRRAA